MAAKKSRWMGTNGSPNTTPQSIATIGIRYVTEEANKDPAILISWLNTTTEMAVPNKASINILINDSNVLIGFVEKILKNDPVKNCWSNCKWCRKSVKPNR
jgi:hypothetical protein